jgi:tripartite-type tricarboxylate transporter receptor subunit TctC
MGGNANFVAENVSGAGGTIGIAKVARANADGHTLLLHHIGMASAPSLYRKLSFKVPEDFEFLGMINEVPMTLIGKPQLAANTYRDFENYIKVNAGKLNIAHAGLGSASHLCGLMWQSRLQASEAMTTIPFGGTAPAMNALVGGQVDIMCDQTQINTALKIALKNPEFIKKQEGLGTIVVNDKRVEPAAHKTFVAAETAKLKPLI